jgi:hypothetical protein
MAILPRQVRTGAIFYFDLLLAEESEQSAHGKASSGISRTLNNHSLRFNLIVFTSRGEEDVVLRS